MSREAITFSLLARVKLPYRVEYTSESVYSERYCYYTVAMGFVMNNITATVEMRVLCPIKAITGTERLKCMEGL